MPGILWIDPDSMAIRVNLAGDNCRECLATILGVVHRDAENPDILVVVRVDPHLAEVHRTWVCIREVNPGVSTVIRAVQPTIARRCLR